MHVLYIHQHFATNQGFLGTRSYDFARYLVARGHRVTVLTGYYPGAGLDAYVKPGLLTRFDLEGIQVVIVRIPYRNQMGIPARVGAFLAFAAVSSALAVALNGVDVVYATSTPLTVGIPALAARFLRGRPYAFEVRDIWPEFLVSMGLLKNPAIIAAAELAERTFYRHARRVVGISQGITDRLAERGLPADKLRTLFTGVDLALYERTPPAPEVLAEHGLAGKMVVIYAGTHSVANRLELGLEAADLLRDDPRIAFLHVGDGKSRDALIARAAELKLPNVVFLPRQAKQVLVGIVKACHVGVLYLMDVDAADAAMPNKVFDYLAAGLPVVVNAKGELARHLVEFDAGAIVPQTTAEAFAATLKALADDPAGLAAKGRNALRLVTERFDRRVLVDEIERILQDVAG